MESDLNSKKYKNMRRSRWVSSLAALHHISNACQDPLARTRKTDLITNIFFMSAIAVATLCLLFPAQHEVLFWCANLFIGITVVYYIGNRLGILTSFTARETIIVMELSLGLMVLAVYITVNLVGWIMWLRSHIPV